MVNFRLCGKLCTMMKNLVLDARIRSKGIIIVHNLFDKKLRCKERTFKNKLIFMNSKIFWIKIKKIGPRKQVKVPLTVEINGNFLQICKLYAINGRVTSMSCIIVV